MRVRDEMVKELIKFNGELESGPISRLGILRLALDLRDTRHALRPAELGNEAALDKAEAAFLEAEGWTREPTLLPGAPTWWGIPEDDGTLSQLQAQAVATARARIVDREREKRAQQP